MAGVGRRSVAIARVTVRPALVRPRNAAVPGAPALERSAGQALVGTRSDQRLRALSLGRVGQCLEPARDRIARGDNRSQVDSARRPESADGVEATQMPHAETVCGAVHHRHDRMNRRGRAADPQMDHMPADRDNALGLGQNVRSRAGGVDDHIEAAAAGDVAQPVGQFAAGLSPQDPVGSHSPGDCPRSAVGSVATTRFAPAHGPARQPPDRAARSRRRPRRPPVRDDDRP